VLPGIRKRGNRKMKRYITTFVMMAMMAVMIPFAAATSAGAQTRYVRSSRVYTTTTYQRPNFYQRHRNIINIGIGTAAGALLGGLIGGKKGALIGTLAGAGGGALYTYKIRPKRTTYYYR
jgi:outer membrane protein with glycine zipper